LIANNILQTVERKNMLRNYRWMMLVTLFALLIATPIMSLAEGPAKFKVARTLFVAGTEIQAGTYDVKYEANGAQAAVSFTAGGKVVKVQGKIEDGGRVSDYNSLMIGKDSAGREAIKALLFRGEKTTVVFD
jgi:hypothetical protein